MKVKKDLRETEEAQDERKNGKTGGNSVRGFALREMNRLLLF